MKHILHRIPRGCKLAGTLLLLLLAAAFLWAKLDYPSFTAASAYRRAAWDAGMPPTKMELLVRSASRSLAIGTDENNAYTVWLNHQNNSLLWDSYDVWYSPAEDGVWYADLSAINTNDNAFDLREESMPAFAVKAPGTRAELTLVLEDWTFPAGEWNYRERTRWYGGSFPLAPLKQRNGWFIFAYDRKLFEDNFQTAEEGYRFLPEPFESLADWYEAWEIPQEIAWRFPPARLRLTTYDADGNILKTAEWVLHMPDVGEAVSD